MERIFEISLKRWIGFSRREGGGGYLSSRHKQGQTHGGTDMNSKEKRNGGLFLTVVSIPGNR